MGLGFTFLLEPDLKIQIQVIRGLLHLAPPENLNGHKYPCTTTEPPPLQSGCHQQMPPMKTAIATPNTT